MRRMFILLVMVFLSIISALVIYNLRKVSKESNTHLSNIEKSIYNSTKEILDKYNENDLITIVHEFNYIFDDATKIKIDELKLINNLNRIGPELTIEGYQKQALNELYCQYTKAIIFFDFVQSLEIEPHYKIADIGTGYGGMAFTFSKFVPNGIVYVTDLNENFILFLNWKKLLFIRDFFYYKHNDEVERGSDFKDNIIPIIGYLDDAKLPHDEIDLIYMQNLHAFCNKPIDENEKNIEISLFNSIISSLNEKGRIIIIDSTHPGSSHRTYKEFLEFFIGFKEIKLILEKEHPNPDWFHLEYINQAAH